MSRCAGKAACASRGSRRRSPATSCRRAWTRAAAPTTGCTNSSSPKGSTRIPTTPPCILARSPSPRWNSTVPTTLHSTTFRTGPRSSNHSAGTSLALRSGSRLRGCGSHRNYRNVFLPHRIVQRRQIFGDELPPFHKRRFQHAAERLEHLIRLLRGGGVGALDHTGQHGQLPIHL